MLTQYIYQLVISTHAPAGGATMICAEIRDGITISTHAPAGGATPLQPYQTRTYRFLLTPLREGRPGGRSSSAHIRPFLLTPLREGRPCDLLDGNAVKFAISTHAPAGGATVYQQFPLADSRPISTHAPAGGATAGTDYAAPSLGLFLLTPLREGRPDSDASMPN